MTGIDKIVEQISADAVETARVTIEVAKKSALEEKSSAVKKATEQCTQIRLQSEKEVADWLDREKSAGMLKKRQMILRTKQELINELIDAAHRRLLEMPDKGYFEMVLKMIEKYALPEKGELLFSPADYQRLPTDFQESVNTVFLEENGSLVIAEQNRSIDGGFVLVYGEIEVNCSFAALFDSAKDRLQDKVNEALFL